MSISRLIPDAPPVRMHPRRRPLADVARAFLGEGSARNLSPRTLEQYEWSIRSFSSFLSAPAPVLADLEPVAVREWIEGLKASRKASSIRSALRALKVFSRWAEAAGYARTDPLASVRLPRVPRSFLSAITGTQLAALMEVAQPVLRAAMAVLADTGLRSSELCGLRIDDVHAGFLRVTGKGGHERSAPYGEACLAEITGYLARHRPRPRDGGEPFFLLGAGRPLTPHRLGELMRTAGIRANISGVRVSPHTLRHTFALEFLRNGGGELALQKALGHRSLDMVRIYAELTAADVADAHRIASPLDAWRSRGLLPAHGRRSRGPVRTSSMSSGERYC